MFDQLIEEIKDGIAGKNSGIPTGFSRLDRHVSIRKSTNYLVGGYTGSGKTSIVDDAFVLNPLDWWMITKTPEPDFHIIYWSMERRVPLKLAKWIARKMFLDNGGVPIPVGKMMGWVPKDERLTALDLNTIEAYSEYYERIQEKVTIIPFPQNPMGIKKHVDKYAAENGTIEKLNEYHRRYIPNDPNKITMIISDHIGLQKGETRGGEKYFTKKQIIDLSSEDKRHFRDFYGFSCIDISQFNRDISNPLRIKNGEVEPMLEDFKDSGNTQEDADVVFALFDPFRYNLPDPNGYNLDKLRDDKGGKRYRSLKILKNSFGADDIRIGLAYQPEIGLFKEMPKREKDKDLSDAVYSSIIDNTYFLK